MPEVASMSTRTTPPTLTHTLFLCALVSALSLGCEPTEDTSAPSTSPHPRAVEPATALPGSGPKKATPKKTVGAPPKSASEALSRARKLASAKKWEEAATVLTEAHGAFPDDPVILNELGYVLYRGEKRLFDAASYLSDAYFKGEEKGADFQGKVRYNQALVALARGEQMEALEYFDESLEHRPNKTVARKRGELLATPPDTTPYKTEVYGSLKEAIGKDRRIDAPCKKLTAKDKELKGFTFFACAPGNSEATDEGDYRHLFLLAEHENKITSIPLARAYVIESFSPGGGASAQLDKISIANVHEDGEDIWVELGLVSKSSSKYEECTEDDEMGEMCGLCDGADCTLDTRALVSIGPKSPGLLAIFDTEWTCEKGEGCSRGDFIEPMSGIKDVEKFRRRHELKGKKLVLGKKSYALDPQKPVIFPGRDFQQRHHRIINVVPHTRAEVTE
jgi:tetratricopeptide (TPR) repeat protein